MRRAQLPSWTVIRAVSLGSTASIVAEVLLIAIVASTVVFFVGIVVKRPMDGLAFFARASFDHYDEAPVQGVEAGGVVVFPAMPVVRDPGPAGSVAFTPRLETVEVDIVPDPTAFARDVLGANAPPGVPQGSALVDADTALRLGVTVGDVIVLDAQAVGADRSASATVGAIISPYVSPGADHATGLVVVPAANADAAFVAAVGPYFPGGSQPLMRTYDGGATGPDTVDRETATMSFALQLFGVDMLASLLGILVFAGVLWVAVASRMIERSVRGSMSAAALLVALGASPVRTRRATLVVPLIGLLVGQVVGVAIVAGLLFPLVLRLTLQPPTLVPILLVLALLSILMVVLAGRFVADALAPQRIVRSLSADEANT